MRSIASVRIELQHLLLQSLDETLICRDSPYSRRAMIILEHTAEPFTVSDLFCGDTGHRFRWLNQPVADALMIPLSAVMLEVFVDDIPQLLLTEENEAVEESAIPIIGPYAIYNVVCHSNTWAIRHELIFVCGESRP